MYDNRNLKRLDQDDILVQIIRYIILIIPCLKITNPKFVILVNQINYKDIVAQPGKLFLTPTE